MNGKNNCVGEKYHNVSMKVNSKTNIIDQEKKPFFENDSISMKKCLYTTVDTLLDKYTGTKKWEYIELIADKDTLDEIER